MRPGENKFWWVKYEVVPDPRDAEIARLREYVQTKEDEMFKSKTKDLVDTIARRNEEILMLRAELEALKPKPVVDVRYLGVNMNLRPPRMSEGQYSTDNLCLTFHDGKLVSAEVINPATNNCEATGDADK